MNVWFRFYSSALDDPKVQRLPPHLFKTWVNLLCVANDCNGILPSIDDIGFRLRMSAHEIQVQYDELIGLGLIDIRNDMKHEPHNWMKRQFVFHSSTARVRKHRKNKTKSDETVSCNGDVTLPEQNRPDSEQKRPPLAPPIGGARAARKFRGRRAANHAAAMNWFAKHGVPADET